MVQRHITYGNCYALDDTQYFNLKSRVAKEFDLHHSCVLLVGSAKLGFSIVPDKRYRGFCDQSDIDVAIISPDLFDQMWIALYDYNKQGGFWPKMDEFQKYLFRGWLRPDKFPPDARFDPASRWWEFFRELTQSQMFGPFAIKAGLYKSWHFLESYQGICIASCKDLLRGEA
jgi:hypothetical protein